jgi:hypothetical protein
MVTLLGLIPAPTPAGVPVMMTVPARRVVPWDRKLIISGTLKMRSLIVHSKGDVFVSQLPVFPPGTITQQTYSRLQSCITVSFNLPRTCSLAGSGTSDLEAITGPTGVLSQELVSRVFHLIGGMEGGFGSLCSSKTRETAELPHTDRT